MMFDLTCPYCDRHFEAALDWSGGECTCGQYYYFSECPNEDYSDSWIEVEWE